MVGPSGPGGITWTPPYTGYYSPAGNAQMSVADRYTTDPVTVVGPPGGITATYSGNGHEVTITAAPPSGDPNAHDPSKTTIIVQGKLGSVTFTHDTTIGGLKSELNAAWAGIPGAFNAIGNAITAAWNDVTSAVSGGIKWLEHLIFANVMHGPGANAADVTAGSMHHSNSIGHDSFAFGAHHFG